jgi:hypothetical protein
LAQIGHAVQTIKNNNKNDGPRGVDRGPEGGDEDGLCFYR